MEPTETSDEDVTAEDFADKEFIASDEEKNYVKREVARTREFVSNLSMDDLKSGDWFAKLLAFSLNQYVTQVDAAYFKEKYPNLPPDAVVDARIKMAANYAAIEGALSSSAYTGAVAATIGSGGGASPLTLPAGGASFVIDLSYTSYLQLRMTHDISVLYAVPLDLNDPDDTWKLVKLAFGIKAGEAAGGAVMKGLPAFVRPIVKKIFSGSTLAALKSLPVVGKHLLQRNIIKFTIPGVTIPVTTAVIGGPPRRQARAPRSCFAERPKSLRLHNASWPKQRTSRPYSLLCGGSSTSTKPSKMKNGCFCTTSQCLLSKALTTARHTSSTSSPSRARSRWTKMTCGHGSVRSPKMTLRSSTRPRSSLLLSTARSANRNSSSSSDSPNDLVSNTTRS